MMAPPAMQQGRHVAAQIQRASRGESLEPFRFRDKGVMATIGRSAGVAALGRLRLKGWIGWIAWLFVHLYYLIGFRNRFVVLSRWTYNYFRLDRPIRLITRSGASKIRSTSSSSSP
jgi:NADH dehydrogenase